MTHIDCAWNAQQECIDAVITGLDAEYGLTLIETSGAHQQDSPNRVDAYETKSGSAVIVFRPAPPPEKAKTSNIQHLRTLSGHHQKANYT